jgi:16S rRNA (uracil1498-N3)-methyltransferase
MRLHRFYAQQPLGEEVVIDDVSLIAQWTKVLRYDSGDSVILFNGDGFDYTYTITDISRKACNLRVIKTSASYIPQHKSYLFLASIKKDLFELTTEKAVELGVTDIIPISTDRTGKKNLDYRRLELTIKEAIEQSGRGDIPRLHSELSLEQALLFAKENVDASIYVATLGGEPFTSTMKPTKDFALFIGPEGGWSDPEENLFTTASLIRISLGKTTLRAETAAISAISLLALY